MGGEERRPEEIGNSKLFNTSMKTNATRALGDTNHCVLVTIRVTGMDLAAGAVQFVSSEQYRR